MSRKLARVIGAFAPAIVVWASEQPLEPRDWRDYPTDFTAFRMELGWAEDFRARCERDYPIGELRALTHEAKWTEAVESGRSWLDRCPVDMWVHDIVRVALAELDRLEESDIHRRWTKGLLESVAASGDGQTTETAYITISIPEGYAVMELLGLRILERSVTTDSDRQITADVFAVEDSRGNKSTLHFKPEAHFARIRQAKPWSSELGRKIAVAMEELEASEGVEASEAIDRLRHLVKDFPPELKAEIWAEMGLTGQDVDQAESAGNDESEP